MNIRSALPQDAAAISALALSVAHFFTLDPNGQGAEDFLQTLGTEAIASRLQTALFKTWVGLAQGNDLAGVIVTRDSTHLFHLFVAEPFQRRGYARQLWQHVLAQNILDTGSDITVNATPFAQGFYERIGFLAAGPRVETRGIAYIPMRRPGDSPRSVQMHGSGD